MRVVDVPDLEEGGRLRDRLAHEADRALEHRRERRRARVDQDPDVLEEVAELGEALEHVAGVVQLNLDVRRLLDLDHPALVGLAGARFRLPVARVARLEAPEPEENDQAAHAWIERLDLGPRQLRPGLARGLAHLPTDPERRHRPSPPGRLL